MCGVVKPLDNFILRTDTGRRRTECLACKQERYREYYHANKGLLNPRASTSKACPYCGVQFMPWRGQGRRFCSRACSNKANRPAWKGGRFVDQYGYVRIWTNGKVLAEHRVIMAQALGLPLLPTEQVHHKNGVRADNRIGNLELWTRHQPTGVRLGDAPHCSTCTCT